MLLIDSWFHDGDDDAIRGNVKLQSTLQNQRHGSLTPSLRKDSDKTRQNFQKFSEKTIASTHPSSVYPFITIVKDLCYKSSSLDGWLLHVSEETQSSYA